MPFYFICNIQKKKKRRRENWHWPVRKKNSKIKNQNLNFEFWISKFKKKKCGIYFDSIFMSRDRAKLSSHWAKIPSQDHFKIWASEPLSRDPSHRAMIQPSQAEIEVPKPKSKPPSLWAEIRAIGSSYKPSWVEPRYLSYFFVNKLKSFIKITPWVWRGMLRNPT